MSHETPKYPRRFTCDPRGSDFFEVAAPGVDAVLRDPAQGWVEESAFSEAELEVEPGMYETFDHHELHAPPEAKAFDPATLDWEGVGHVAPPKKRFYYHKDNPNDVMVRDADMKLHPNWIEFPSPVEMQAELTLLRQSLADSQSREKQERALRAEAEAEVAKLRERVAVLEAAILDSRQETLFKLTCIESAIEPLRKAVENRRWLGDPNPSDHEAAELRGEVRS